MNIRQYVKSSRGMASFLSRALGVSPVVVCRWAKGRAVPVSRCLEIERETGGAVRCEDLRPDVDWAVLRGKPLPGGEGA